MEFSKTAVCKLKPTPEEAEKLLATLTAFRDACNYISEVAFSRRIFNPVALHHIIYRDTRQKFNLPANLAIRARDRVAKAYKTQKDVLAKFDATSMDLDERLFRLVYKADGICASIATTQKRVKPAFSIGEYQRRLLEGTRPTNAKLVFTHGEFFLHITVTKDIPEAQGSNPIGVDVGMTKVLVASNGYKRDGKALLARRHHFRELRATLQSKGTTSAKRKLKRLSGKEERWTRNFMHQVSREFVESLSDDIVVMEDLTGIRGRVRRRHTFRGDFHSWPFRLLQSYVDYKATERGIPIVYIDPRNSSKTCPRCGNIDKTNRRTQALFRCVKCGFQHNADYVAALNLSRAELAPSGRAVVNQPNAGNRGFDHSYSPASPQPLGVGS